MPNWNGASKPAHPITWPSLSTRNSLDDSTAMASPVGRYMTKEPINILLVDDQPAKLLSYEAILQHLGENLITAGSAREALEHLLKTDIAIVLTDVCMPELDGFELAGMIRDQSSLSADGNHFYLRRRA